jgi:hypothetical protein
MRLTVLMPQFDNLLDILAGDGLGFILFIAKAEYL